MPGENLTGQFVSSTYQRLLQIYDENVRDGTGSVVDLLPVTSSYALTASYIVGGEGVPVGPDNSLQFKTLSGFSGSANLLYDDASTSLTLTGSIFLSGSAAIAGVNYIDFLTTANPTHQEGRVHWTDDTKTLQVDTDVNDFMIELGHQNVVRVYNPYNFDLTVGTVVYISGSQGAGRPRVATASWEGDPTSAATLGLVGHTIPYSGGNKTGYVVTNGILRGVNTSGIPVGAQLYLSSSGKFTNIVPDAPKHEVRLGRVITSGADGVIYVDVMNGYELDELHDLKVTNSTDGDLLVYSSSLWHNSKQLTGSYGLTGSLEVINGGITGSLLGTASFANYAATSSITYVSNSNFSLSEIEVADYSNDVAVTFVDGRLKFIFGTPAPHTITSFGFNNTFLTDRFNKVLDVYTASAVWSNNGYTLVSAKIYEDGVLVANTTTGTSLNYDANQSGSHTYLLHVTASSPLDNSVLTITQTLAGTLSKVNPGNPTITATPTVQLGATSNQIEQGATGSISFTTTQGTSNGWVHNSTTTNVASPIYVTGSATGSTSISIVATSHYSSSGVNGSDNDPALARTSTSTTTYTKTRSLRYGASSLPSFSLAELEDLAAWDTGLGGDVGIISKGTLTATGQSVTINWTGDKYHYIVYNSSLANLSSIKASGFEVIGSFNAPSTIGGFYKVYRSTTLQAGGAGTSITYTLT